MLSTHLCGTNTSLVDASRLLGFRVYPPLLVRQATVTSQQHQPDTAGPSSLRRNGLRDENTNREREDDQQEREQTVYQKKLQWQVEWAVRQRTRLNGGSDYREQGCSNARHRYAVKRDFWADEREAVPRNMVTEREDATLVEAEKHKNLLREILVHQQMRRTLSEQKRKRELADENLTAELEAERQKAIRERSRGLSRRYIETMDAERHKAVQHERAEPRTNLAVVDEHVSQDCVADEDVRLQRRNGVRRARAYQPVPVDYLANMAEELDRQEEVLLVAPKLSRPLRLTPARQRLQTLEESEERSFAESGGIHPEGHLCTICLSNKIRFVFRCGHCSCVSCGNRIAECHICKRRIMSRQRIYL